MVYTAPLIDAQGQHNGWMSSVVDITAQKQAEEQQRQQAAKMQRTGRLASMGEMASTLAHELSQPLMAMVSFSGAARAFAQRGDQVLLAETLGDISAQAQRAADIVARIRGFVKQQTAGYQTCTLDTVVSNVLGLLRPEIRQQGARVVTRLAPGLPSIEADRLLLEQVLLNLVVNALQAMADKSAADKVVTLETGWVGDAATPLEGGMLFLRVSDHGPGIAPHAQAQLFEPFFTTKAEGLGLGLNICRTTIEAHRGTLNFANLAQGGAVFTVHLPVSPVSRSTAP
jgi:C4-dicarboxylate-specific signal transduction histidine kinase